jgi:hypothetical protein
VAVGLLIGADRPVQSSGPSEKGGEIDDVSPELALALLYTAIAVVYLLHVLQVW